MPVAQGQSQRQLAAVIRGGQRATDAALGVVGLMITNQIKVLITGPAFSQPGRPPGLRTGGLRISYGSKVHKDRGNQGRRGSYVVIRSDPKTHQPVPPGKAVLYAVYLEYGTSTMQARPHFRPAVEAIRPLIPGILGAAWTAGVRRAS